MRGKRVIALWVLGTFVAAVFLTTAAESLIPHHFTAPACGQAGQHYCPIVMDHDPAGCLICQASAAGFGLPTSFDLETSLRNFFPLLIPDVVLTPSFDAGSSPTRGPPAFHS